MTGVSIRHVGEVIRKLREERRLTQGALARLAGLTRGHLIELERRGRDLEQVTPEEWRALDRIAIAFGLGNGASLYKLIPGTLDPTRRRPSELPERPRNQILAFGRRPSKRES